MHYPTWHAFYICEFFGLHPCSWLLVVIYPHIHTYAFNCKNCFVALPIHTESFRTVWHSVAVNVFFFAAEDKCLLLWHRGCWVSLKLWRYSVGFCLYTTLRSSWHMYTVQGEGSLLLAYHHAQIKLTHVYSTGRRIATSCLSPRSDQADTCIQFREKDCYFLPITTLRSSWHM